MIALFIAVFAVMLAVGFMVGCGLAELKTWMKERGEHDD